MDMIYLSVPINIAGPEKRVPMPFQRIVMLVFSAEHRGYSGRIISADLFVSAHKSCSQTFGQRKRMGDGRQRFTPQRVSDAIRSSSLSLWTTGRDGAYGRVPLEDMMELRKKELQRGGASVLQNIEQQTSRRLVSLPFRRNRLRQTPASFTTENFSLFEDTFCR